ncbi:MAG: hypothetical protein Q4C49_08680 [Bacillota bacterium]|nr:hypothetical protein [Bacillota bacterium]
MENDNNKDNQLSSEELQKQLQEALDAQKKLQEQIDQLKKETQVEKEEKKEINVDEYLKNKEEKKTEAKKKKTLGQTLKEYSVTIVFFTGLVLAPPLILKGYHFLQDLQKQRFEEKKEVRLALNGDWESEDNKKLHIDEDGTTYYIKYEGDVISYIQKGVIHEDMVCSQNQCFENENETYESGGVDFTSEYKKKDGDSYKEYSEIPEESYTSTKYMYYDFFNKSETTVKIKGTSFTKVVK